MKNKILFIILFIISNFYSQSQTIDSGGFIQKIINTDNNFTYLGFNFGLAKPLGDFGDLNINNPNAGLAVNGIGISLLNFGATWKGRYGFHFRLFANKNIMKNGVSHQAWNFGGIMIGPSYTIDLFKHAYLDFKPAIGFISSSIFLGKDVVKEGTGLGLGLGTQFRYNFAHKWAITANLDYTSTSQTLKSVGLGTGSDYIQSISAISTNLGAIYYFKAPIY